VPELGQKKKFQVLQNNISESSRYVENQARTGSLGEIRTPDHLVSSDEFIFHLFDFFRCLTWMFTSFSI
jgi:hypothetical protein